MAAILSQYKHLVDFDQKSLFVSAASIAFNPTFWNIVARREHRTRFLTRLFGGRSRTACYFLAGTIFSLGLLRDGLYERALRHQPTHPALEQDVVKYAAYTLLACGNLLVLSSTWALGITVVYLVALRFENPFTAEIYAKRDRERKAAKKET